jgi:hypothetical protein
MLGFGKTLAARIGVYQIVRIDAVQCTHVTLLKGLISLLIDLKYLVFEISASGGASHGIFGKTQDGHYRHGEQEKSSHHRVTPLF